MPTQRLKFIDEEVHIGESRFIFAAKPGPAETGGTAIQEPAPIVDGKMAALEAVKTSTTAGLHDLKTTFSAQDMVANQARNLSEDPTERTKTIGESFAALCAVFKDISEVWKSIFSAFGDKISQEELVSYAKTAALTQKEKEPVKPAPETWSQRNEKMSYSARNKAHNAKIAVDTHPDWKDYIEKASNRHGISTSTIVAFIEMESGFDPNRVTLASTGFGQAEKPATDEYEKWLGAEGRDLGIGVPVNMKDPRTSINFVAFYAKKLIKDVDSIIAQKGATEGFRADYALNEKNVGNIWLAYNCGAEGYLKLRWYMDLPNYLARQENIGKLPAFLRAEVAFRGEKMLRWKMSTKYAGEVSEVAGIYEALEEDPESAPPINFPPLGYGHAYSVSSGFGYREHPIKKDKRGNPKKTVHEGVDYPAPLGTPVYAVKSGMVKTAGNYGAAGNYILIYHNDGTSSEYMHLNTIDVEILKKDQSITVNAGQKIGEVGSTGRSTGNHLHFGYKNSYGRPINPEIAVAKSTQKS